MEDIKQYLEEETTKGAKAEAYKPATKKAGKLSW
jgi:hypothetical protein